MLRKAKFDKEIKLRAVAFVNQKVLTIHISVYIVADYKVHKSICNNDKIGKGNGS